MDANGACQWHFDAAGSQTTATSAAIEIGLSAAWRAVHQPNPFMGRWEGAAI